MKVFRMGIPFYHVDTFTDRLFRGNPAGVCFLPDWLPDDVLQSIAAENALAETAFVVQREGRFDIRWFTPWIEMDLCGHATLAPAHVLFEHLHHPGDEIAFQSRSGLLKVSRGGDWLTLDFPSRPPESIEIPDGLIDALGVTPDEVGKSRDLLAVFNDPEIIERIQPKMELLMQLDALGVIVTAPGRDGVDFVSRFFAPKAGVPEDPVTGSAHSTLIPYWASRLGKSRMEARQVSQRGGVLRCELRKDRVGISGQALLYSSGFIHLKHSSSVG
jgi:PhzF family phenazine biosynthesis protein